MNTQAILHCLPLLADVLGRAYGVAVEIGGTEAFTTGRVIRLPSLPATGDTTFLGLVRGYIDHEAAHVRHTDFDAMAKETITPLERHIWNVFEDWRVEAKLGAIFPGCRRNFEWLIRHLFLQQPSQPHHPVHAITDWLLLTVRSWSVPDLIPLCRAEAEILDRHWPGLIHRLGITLTVMRGHCPDSLAALEYARQVVRCLGDIPPSTDSALSLRSLLDAVEGDLPDDLGQVLKRSLGEKAETVGRCAVATIGEKPLSPLSRQDLSDIARVTAGLRARFHGMLQATRLVRRRPSRRGRIDPRRTYGIAIGDPQVFLTHQPKPAINTAVHILLDTSASMRERIGLACQCCAALAQALDQVGISVGITAFPGDPAASKSPTVVPILQHGDQRHGNLLVATGGQTPLAEAMWWVLQRLAPLKQDRKIVLIITDGSPDNQLATREAIRAGLALGVEIYGLGILAPQIGSFLPHSSTSITSLAELPSALFALLGQALTRGRAAA
ncbi:VWA domain-containing protein [Magnetospirillum sp. SS-4]|uniref:cobaltochelatase CobT-related protein n=1 Tax=Magnetospirillum sp. SS-4 TaxID=2681465 RepID=UPI00137CC13F|nr:VWA domain-containing protein [Magnetospirillum sp. SS-4]CAA7617398.1 von Willebrand factor type A [Magnetospirillum sp. SS-4]